MKFGSVPNEVGLLYSPAQLRIAYIRSLSTKMDETFSTIVLDPKSASYGSNKNHDKHDSDPKLRVDKQAPRAVSRNTVLRSAKVKEGPAEKGLHVRLARLFLRCLTGIDCLYKVCRKIN